MPQIIEWPDYEQLSDDELVQLLDEIADHLPELWKMAARRIRAIDRDRSEWKLATEHMVDNEYVG